MPRHPPLALRSLEVDEDARARYAILNRRGAPLRCCTSEDGRRNAVAVASQELLAQHSLKAEERTVHRPTEQREVRTPDYLVAMDR